MRRRVRSLLLAVPFLLFAVSCTEAGPPPPPPGISMKQLETEGRCPVEVSGIARSMSPMPAFNGRIKNVSNRPVTVVMWTTVFVDGDGKPVGDPVDGGYEGALDPIPPDGEIEGNFMAPDDAAVEARIVIKEILYEEPNPLGEEYGGMHMKWSNPDYDADLAAARDE